MSNGTVVSIFVGPVAEAPMKSVLQVRALAGKGLESDRYETATGTYSDQPSPSREATLIESEAVEAATIILNAQFGAAETRRNIVTRGTALNHLVEKEFRVGEALLRGIRLCEPCEHLESLTRRGVRLALLHRGGLRAQILRGGMIRVGDEVAPTDSVEEKSLKIIRRYYEEMWNPWNFDVVAEIVAENIVFYGSLGVATHGIEAFRQYMQTVRAAFPDFHNKIEDVIVEDNKIVAHLAYSGTHRGEVFGIAPTGKRIQYAGAAFFRIADGRVAEGWVLGDRLGLLEQLRGA